jgi:arginase family enzyme
VGGDHLTTLPVLRAVAKQRPVGLIHFDAHSDTNDRYFGDNTYTHGTPFRRAIEEGLLDPKRIVQMVSGDRSMSPASMIGPAVRASASSISRNSCAGVPPI